MSKNRLKKELREAVAKAELLEAFDRQEAALTSAAKSRVDRKLAWLDAIVGRLVKWIGLPALIHFVVTAVSRTGH